MTGRRAVLAAAAAPVLAGQGSPTSHGVARGIFALNVARTYGVDRAALRVLPDVGGPPEDSLPARLRTGPFHAFEARFDLAGEPVQVRGFAAPGHGAALVRLRDGLERPVGIAPVLRALGMAGPGPGPAAPLPQIVARVLWAWAGPGEPAEHPAMPWRLGRENSTMVLHFLMLEAGRTGSLVTHAVRVVLEGDGASARIERVQIPTPAMLPARVRIEVRPVGV
jgi:hypothetical protein